MIHRRGIAASLVVCCCICGFSRAESSAVLVLLPSESGNSSLFIAGAVETGNEEEISSFVLKTAPTPGFVFGNAKPDVFDQPFAFTKSVTEISATTFSSAVPSERLISIGDVLPDSIDGLSQLTSFLNSGPTQPRYVPVLGSGVVKRLLLAEARGCDMDAPTVPPDGYVVTCDTNDLDMLTTEFNLAQDNPAAGHEKFDLNGDQSINIQDLHLFRAQAGLVNGGDARYLMGDANLDGKVEFRDFLLMSNNFSKNKGQLGLNGELFNGEWSRGDFDGNNKVDFADFLQLSVNFNKSIPSLVASSAAAVPEPIWGRAFALLALGCLVWRRRQQST